MREGRVAIVPSIVHPGLTPPFPTARGRCPLGAVGAAIGRHGDTRHNENRKSTPAFATPSSQPATRASPDWPWSGNKQG